MLRSLILVVLGIFTRVLSQHFEYKYVGILDKSLTGVVGFFGLKINSTGTGSYLWSFDMTDFVPSQYLIGGGCTLDYIKEYGLKYHIHQSWQGNNQSSTSCSSVGGHYDPFLSCSAKSQSANTLCVEISRTSSTGYQYSCNSSNYARLGHESYCEVGDLSGKFGIMMPNDSKSLMFTGVVPVDPNPVIVANYQSSDTISPPWGSVVFHCPISSATLNTPAIFCAQLVPYTEPFSVSPSSYPVSTPTVDYSGEFTAILNTATLLTGAPGYFQVRIDEQGVGNYYWNFDLSNLPTGTLSTQDIQDIASYGIKYHIHTSWSNGNNEDDSISCPATVTGGHYDPYLACSPKSEYTSSLCTSLSRTEETGFKYICNSTNYPLVSSISPFGKGQLAVCEVGDLSGKNGLMKPVVVATGNHDTKNEENKNVRYSNDYRNGIYSHDSYNNRNMDKADTASSSSLRFTGSYLNDPIPPITRDYTSGLWQSIVFHKPFSPSAAFYCAKFYTGQITSLSPTLNDPPITDHTTAVIVVLSSLFVFSTALFYAWKYRTKLANISSGIGGKSGKSSMLSNNNNNNSYNSRSSFQIQNNDDDEYANDDDENFKNPLHR